jgi:hypothetical protein
VDAVLAIARFAKGTISVVGPLQQFGGFTHTFDSLSFTVSDEDGTIKGHCITHARRIARQI